MTVFSLVTTTRRARDPGCFRYEAKAEYFPETGHFLLGCLMHSLLSKIMAFLTPAMSGTVSHIGTKLGGSFPPAYRKLGVLVNWRPLLRDR